MKLAQERISNLVIGSGAAGFAAAISLVKRGRSDTAIVTENVLAGTSRNTGSDKQTYYKLSLAGSDRDSVLDMAQDLFAGGCVDGDIALCEAALSVRGFFHLVEAGVPFPCTEYGEYMGYKTDHDRGRRATSAGPYTSRMMTECLEREAHTLGIRILDGLQVIRLLVREGRIYGVLCLERHGEGPAFRVLWCRNAVLATGGPAGMYRDSVYPASQLGASGLAFEAGVRGKNLTEWQYGMASIAPRWNVSGTYMQVLPRFVSTEKDGGDEREFLSEYYEDMGQLLGDTFLKGYQWPFDTAKIFGGSSVIDLLVYRESVLRGRRVFLDFTRNPGGEELDFSLLPEEAYAYLEKAGALFGTPIERLSRMNEPAISFYRDHQVDLWTTPLEIAICAQHNNGGLATDAYWETDIAGLFAVGEVCGSHGVTRPGGTALNAGQAGAARCAERIAGRARRGEEPDRDEAAEEALLREAEDFAAMPESAHGDRTAAELFREAAGRMSGNGAMIRSHEGLADALEETQALLSAFQERVIRPEPQGYALYFRLREILISQKVYLSAMLSYLESGAGSRGSALYTDPEGELCSEKLPEIFRCRLDGGKNSGRIQEIGLWDGVCRDNFRPVRPIPEVDYFFENQWRAFREREGQ